MKKANRLIIFSVLIVSFLVGGFILYKHFNQDKYDSKDSFSDYANSCFDKINKVSEFGTENKIINYNEKLSYAANYPSTDNAEINTKIKAYIRKQKEAFYSDKSSDGSKYKKAILIGYNAYTSDKGTKSISIITEIKKEGDNEKMNTKTGNVKTFNYKDKDNIELNSYMVFNNKYINKIKEIILKNIERKYSDNLNKNYKEYLDNNDVAENYVLYKNTAKIILPANTVVLGKEGTIIIEIKGENYKNLIKKKINPRSINPNKPMVALTFDDGPHGEFSDRILDVFDKTNTVATFFELGNAVDTVSNAKEILQREESLGCEVASHSYSHPNLYTLTGEQIKDESDKTDKAIEKKIGHKPNLYRPPYGNGNVKISKEFNKPGILWSVDTLDWKSKNTQKVIDSIKSQSALDGKVILMHSIHETTIGAVEEIVPWLKDKGYQLVTVSELLTYKYKEDPKEVKYYGYNAFYPSEPLD